MKKISVFIDASNFFHCQLKNGWMVDFVKLKKKRVENQNGQHNYWVI